MSIKIKKIIKIMFIGIPVAIVLLLLLGFLYTYLVTKIVAFQIDKKIINKYSYIFNSKYTDNIRLNNSDSSKFLGQIYYYTYHSHIISVMELKQLNNIILKDLKIKDFILKGENVKFLATKITATSHLNPHLIIGLYPNFKKIEHINIYMKNKIEKQLVNKNYLYIKFAGSSFSISSTEEYPDLTYILAESKNPTMEFIILKHKDKTLFILKYQGKDSESNQENISLLDLINVN